MATTPDQQPVDPGSPPSNRSDPDGRDRRGFAAASFVSIENVTWLELFYDLVMVAAIIVFSHGLSEHPTWGSALKSVVVFSVLWWVWLITTLLVNCDPSTNTVRRGLLFAQMLTMVVLIIIGSHTEIPWRDPLAPVVGVLLGLVAALHEVTRRTRPDLRIFTRSRRDAFAVGGVLAAVSGLVPAALTWLLWGATAVLMVVPVVLERYDQGIDRPASNLKHLAERLAALTTIVIGESFVRVALTGSGRHLYEIDFVVVCLEFVVVCSIWIAYFDSIAVAGMPPGRRRQRWWLIGHLPLHLGVIGTAVGLGALAVLRQDNDLADGDVWLLTAPLVVSFVSLGGLGLCSARTPKVPLLLLRLGTAAVVAVVAVVAWRSAQVTIQEAVASYGVVAVAYVVASHELLRHTTVPGPLGPAD